MSLFRKNIDPRCAYCRSGKRLSQDEIGCVRHGVVTSWSSCRHFVYEPLKRMPAKPVKLTKSLADIDFEA